LFGFAGQHQQNAELACYDIATGRELWRDDLGGKFQRGSLLRADGGFLCLGENGDLAWLDLTRAGAKVRASAKLFHAPGSWTGPALSDGRLFICQNEPGSGGTKPRVICYDLRGN
jgi:outer membrane protein assembly factor BamB